MKDDSNIPWHERKERYAKAKKRQATKRGSERADAIADLNAPRKSVRDRPSGHPNY